MQNRLPCQIAVNSRDLKHRNVFRDLDNVGGAVT
jgi:hypothetical protein